MDEFEKLIERYVRKDYSVLEAGCGPGHLVASLAMRGYTVCGVDNEAEVIEFAKSVFPELDIRFGNILCLDIPSKSIGCYLSVGVVEHLIEGPENALREAHRVLLPDGKMLISVPYLNPLRKEHLETLHQEEVSSAYSFHQYYFGVEEFNAILSEAGFNVIDIFPYAVEAFMIREHPMVARLWRSSLARERAKRVLRALFHNPPNRMRYRYSHMMMYVCEPFKSIPV